jgi:hypothetical protein
VAQPRKLLGWSMGIRPKFYGDESGTWHAIVETSPESAGAACGAPVSGQLHPKREVYGHPCNRLACRRYR